MTAIRKAFLLSLSALLLIVAYSVGSAPVGVQPEELAFSSDVYEYEGIVDPKLVDWNSLEAVAPEDLRGGQSTLGCTNYSTRYRANGCCCAPFEPDATKYRQQMCIYGTWYWTSNYYCASPYCLCN